MPDVVITRDEYPRPIASGRQALTVDNTGGGVVLTIPAKSTYAFCRLETAQIRFTLDTTAPTTTVGWLLEVGETLELHGRYELANFKAIRTGGTSGTLEVEYWRTDDGASS